MKAMAEGTILDTMARDGHLFAKLLLQNNALEQLETLFRYMLQADDSIDINSLQNVVAQAVTSRYQEVKGITVECYD